MLPSTTSGKYLTNTLSSFHQEYRGEDSTDSKFLTRQQQSGWVHPKEHHLRLGILRCVCVTVNSPMLWTLAFLDLRLLIDQLRIVGYMLRCVVRGWISYLDLGLYFG